MTVPERICGAAVQSAVHPREAPRNPAGMTDQRIEKWTRWINGTINNNVLTMHLQRDAWRKVSQILEANGQLPDSYWWEFMRDTYATTQAIAVRRQADTHRDAASLGKLIEEMRDDATRVTRSFWIGLWRSPDDPIDRRVAERAWADTYGGATGTHLDPAIPTADLAALTAAAANVKDYVDQHLAHADSVPTTVTLTLSDVHDAIDVIGELFRKYYTLLTAASYVDLVPIIQHDWLAAFRQPWIRSAADRAGEEGVE
jgi:hypothetical protein